MLTKSILPCALAFNFTIIGALVSSVASVACAQVNGQTNTHFNEPTGDGSSTSPATSPATPPPSAPPSASKTLPEAPPGTAQCSASFIEAARRVVINLQAIQKSQQEKAVPKNAGPAARACNKLEVAFPTYTCQINNKLVGGMMYAAPCKQIRDYAAKLKIEIPPEVPAPTAAEVTDQTPVATLALDGLRIRLTNSNELLRASAEAKSVFFIKGNAYDVGSSIVVNDPIRCTIDVLEKSKSDPMSASRDKTIVSKFIEESLQSQNFITSISFENQNWTLDCSKHSFGARDVDYGLTYGELKEALGRHAEITYQPTYQP